MTAFDEQLHTLAAQNARLIKVCSILEELKRQRIALTAREQELAAVRIDEQRDVDRLEGRSLAAFFYAAIGKREEKLDKEQQKAYAAAVKHDAVVRELAAVQQDIRMYTAERDSLAGCEQRYAEAMENKRNALIQQGDVQSGQIIELEDRLASLRAFDHELDEAIRAGDIAEQTASAILSELDSAEGWGTFDLVGGSFLSTAIKHDHLDSAQEQIEILQSQLRSFKTELSDVNIEADTQSQVDGFLRFADYFFDGLLVDWAVLDHIHDAQAQIATTENQIRDVLQRLNRMQRDCRNSQAAAKHDLDTLITNA